MTDEPPSYLRLGGAGPKGLGLFTDRRLAARTVVLKFSGQRLRSSEVVDFSRAIQVGADAFLGPSQGLDDYVNHSCDPNCRLAEHDDELRLVTLRSVPAGHELTFDYSTCMLIEEDLEQCACGVPRCRGRVASFAHLPKEIQLRYLRLNAVPAFLVEICDEQVLRLAGRSANHLNGTAPVRRRRAR